MKYKVDAHIRVVENVCSILPISRIVIEVAQFDTQKIKNPEISGKEYQEGDQLEFWNTCACVSNVVNSFIINGRVMKSVNQWYNKKKAKLMSFVGDKGSSNRIRRITLFRNCWIEDKLHKISRYIVNFCRSNNIGTIIIGLNKEWKQEINIGKRNNQHFISIPHSKLIEKIVYKAKLLGINVIVHEESYTSKIDHLAFEPLKKQESYLGRRKKRGLFQSSIGELINADINGAIGIARKVIGDSFIGKIIDSGFVFNPIRVNTLCYKVESNK